MTDKMICMRCKGRKKVYRIMGGYSHVNSGGVEIECPMCNGTGKHKTLEAATEDAEKTVRKYKKEDANERKRQTDSSP